jgi:DNA-binding CsgD family transcriptional regulator
MRLALIERHGTEILGSPSIDGLHEALARAARDMGFDRFALSLEIGRGVECGTSVLVHDYPPSWADIYTSFNLAETDSVLRASEQSLLAFRWTELRNMVPMTKDETATFEMGQRHGLADGFSVPRHLPGSMTGCCTFAVGADTPMPNENIVVADALGATAIARARHLSGWPIPLPETKLTDRQRDCVLWAARGKTDWEISRILNIGRATVIQHLTDARQRYNTSNRASLILCALFDGVIGFADIFRWRKRR